MLVIKDCTFSAHLCSGITWVIGAWGGPQFFRPKKSWDAWCLLWAYELKQSWRIKLRKCTYLVKIRSH